MLFWPLALVHSSQDCTCGSDDPEAPLLKITNPAPMKRSATGETNGNKMLMKPGINSVC